MRRSDIRLSQAQFRFSPRPKSNRVVRKFSWTGHAAYTENGDGRVETRDMRAEFSIEFQNSDTFSARRHPVASVPRSGEPSVHREGQSAGEVLGACIFWD